VLFSTLIPRLYQCPSYTPPSTRYFLVAIARAVYTIFYVQCLLYGSESRSIMYTFIYSNLHSHGYEDVTIHHQRTFKNTITLLNFPYIHSHIQSHSPRAPPWPSPPGFCGLVLAVNQYVVASFSTAGAIHQQSCVGSMGSVASVTLHW